VAILIATLVGDLFQAAGEGESPSIAPIAFLVFSIVLASWLRYRERLDGERLGQAVAHGLRLRLTEHLVRLPPVMDRRSSGDVLLRFIGDLGALRTWYSRGVVSLLVSIPVVLGALGAIAWHDWRIAMAIGVVLGLVAVVQMTLSTRLHAAAETARRMRGRLASDVAERMDALASVQMFGRSGAEARRIGRRSDDLAVAMIERARWSGRLRAATEWLALGVPLVVLGVWLMSGEANIGVGASAIAISAMLTPRMRELGRVLEYHTLARISRERVTEFLERDTLDDRPEGRGLRRRDGDLKLKHLTLDGVFADLNVQAPGGSRIALMGPNGAGKSRLLGLIAGLEDPSSGAVVLDRQNATIRQRGALRKVVALASIDTPLMRSSVETNIRYGSRADEEEAAAILELGGYEAFVDQLPNGGATRIGPGGKGLSQGQKRRIILLRALMRRPRLLLLDEIEVGMDEDGLATIGRVFESFDGSILMATHSNEWRDRCDTVWRLENSGLTIAPALRQVRDHG
jgi:ATP-binding cassette subfamily B protein